MNKRSASSRLAAIDALRGLIIVVMALDHANHFVAQKHSSGEYWGGSFPVYTDALPFLTRFVTHFAAPGFFLLMGTGMVLFTQARRRQGWAERRLIVHFVVRGLLLIALQFLVVNRAWAWSPGGWAVSRYVGVLFALGGTMILGSFLLRVRPSILLVLTAVLLIGTEMLVPDPNQWQQGFSEVNRLLLTPGGDLSLWVNFPILPWLELVLLGMAVGHWFAADAARAARRVWWLGVGCLLAFGLLRLFAGFGNIRPQTDPGWIGFLNVVKYPPSIVFSSLTVGVNLVILAVFTWIPDRRQPLLQPLVVFGRVPLFFYIAHLFLYAALGHLLTPAGTSLPVMYLFWLLGLLILYPFCRWYAGLKRQRPANLILRFL